MSLLTKVTTGRIGRPQKVVITAPEGFGKSTLASLFPAPLFFDVEDSTAQLEVQRLGRSVLPDLKTLESGIAEVVAAKACGTLVVDTVDWLEQMAETDVIAAADSAKIKGIEDFGYGKGYIALKERITLFLSKLDRVIAAGMHVVLLAHSKVVKFEPPDGAGPYDRYELKLSKHVAPLVKEWADMLLFGNWRLQVKEKEKNEAGAQFKGVGGRERQMHCNRAAAWDAKNRHGMSDVEKWDIATIEQAFKRVGAPWGEVSAVPTVAAPTAKAEPVKKAPAAKKTLETGAVATPATTGQGKPASDDATPQKQPTDTTTGGAEKTPMPATAAPSPSSEESDEIPMGEIPAPSPVATPTPATPDDAELERILGPYEALANAYILDKKKIQPGQTWRDAPGPEAGWENYKGKILKNPAGFIDAITAFAKLMPEVTK